MNVDCGANDDRTEHSARMAVPEHRPHHARLTGSAFLIHHAPMRAFPIERSARHRGAGATKKTASMASARVLADGQTGSPGSGVRAMRAPIAAPAM
jgi:hypothetical protein